MDANKLLDGGIGEPERVRLQAGPLTAWFEAGTLRDVRLGGIELVRQVYAAVRDPNWATIPGRLHDIETDRDDHQTRIRFVSEHRHGEIHFIWRGDIVGTPEGRLIFRFDGEALSEFRRNRIGFCVLHPAGTAGRPCIITHTDGRQEQTTLPKHISPHQPFLNVRAMRHEAAPGVFATVLMEGDTFETEDQRNWTDASFKTYCTPLALPFPASVAQGDIIRQSVTIWADGMPPAETRRDVISLRVTEQPAPLPAVGIGLNTDGAALSAREIRLLRQMRPAHVRVDLRPAEASMNDRLAQAVGEARAIGCPLEIAVHVQGDAPSAFDAVRHAAAALRPDIARWLVFRDRSHHTPTTLIDAARAALSGFGAPIGGGTDAFFAELNRNRPDPSRLDCVAYSVNPQVHAFDNRTLFETLEAQGATVDSARAFSGGKPIAVTPITLKMRWNPNATSPDAPPPPDMLPHQVDMRQMSLLGAAWTIGSIAALTAAGASSLTYYEATGWLGVIERESGSPLPQHFPSQPGMVYPVYVALRALAPFAGGTARPVEASDPLRVSGLMLGRDSQRLLLLVNFTPRETPMRLEGLTGPVRMTALTADNAQAVLHDPDSLWRDNTDMSLDGRLSAALAPYGLYLFDFQDGTP